MMQINNNKNNTAVFILTIVFPFAGLIYSLSHWRKSWAKNVFWLVCVYLGTIFIYWPEGTILGEGADGGRYALDLMRYHSSGITLSGVFASYALNGGGQMDLYQPLLTFIVSRFTDNGHVLFAVFAFVFGFFYSRNIWFVLERLPNRKLGRIGILVALYFLICPITQINGVRMWTGLHVFVYAMLPFLVENDRSKIWWLILVPFIHFSYLYVTVFAAVYVLFLNRIATRSQTFQIIALFLFIASFTVNSLNMDSVNSMIAEYSPESYEERIDMYVNQAAANRMAEASGLGNWYIAASGNLQHWCYALLLVLLLPCLRSRFNGNKGYMNLWVFALLLGGLSNILAMLPAGGRFQFLSMMFKVALILLVAANIPKTEWYAKLVNVTLIALLIPLVVEVRTLFDYFSFTLVLGNFLTAFFIESNVPIIDFIKGLI